MAPNPLRLPSHMRVKSTEKTAKDVDALVERLKDTLHENGAAVSLVRKSDFKYVLSSVEDAAAAHGFDRLVEAQAAVDPFADAFQAEKTGMAFVGVEHLRVQAERSERTNAADAQDDFLAEAVLLITAIQPVGDRHDLRRILRQVGVEEVERNAADIDSPDGDLGSDASQVNLDPYPGVANPE